MSARPVSNLLRAFALCTLSLLLWAPAAAAVEADKNPNAGRELYRGFDGTACEAEFKKHCTIAYTKNAGYDCIRLFYKRGELTPECAAHSESLRKERQAKAMAMMQAWRKACAGDIPKLCADYADAKPKTVKGCLSKQRDQLSAACNEALPLRPGYKGDGAIRWRDGTEDDDWELNNAMQDRPRKTQEEIEAAGGVEAWKEQQRAKRTKKQAEQGKPGKNEAETKVDAAKPAVPPANGAAAQ